jgi:hypothetical protein
MAVTRTSGRVIMSTEGDSYVGDLRVLGVNWSGASNGHNLILNDQNTKNIFSHNAVTGDLDVNVNCDDDGRRNAHCVRELREK